MVERTAINVSLQIGSRVLDLRVPRYVSCDRLQELLQDALAEHPVQLPLQWELKVLDKHLRLEEHVPLKDYPLGDGDRLAVVPHGGCGESSQTGGSFQIRQEAASILGEGINNG